MRFFAVKMFKKLRKRRDNPALPQNINMKPKNNKHRRWRRGIIFDLHRAVFAV
jgi:hypothetical protein